MPLILEQLDEPFKITLLEIPLLEISHEKNNIYYSIKNNTSTSIVKSSDVYTMLYAKALLADKTSSILKNNIISKELILFPNPVKINNEIHLEFTLSNSNNISISIYNIQGSLLKSIVEDKTLDAGKHLLSFSTHNLKSGTYVCKMIINNEVVSSKVFIVE